MDITNITIITLGTESRIRKRWLSLFDEPNWRPGWGLVKSLHIWLRSIRDWMHVVLETSAANDTTRGRDLNIWLSGKQHVSEPS
jgi:hypothetical protein